MYIYILYKYIWYKIHSTLYFLSLYKVLVRGTKRQVATLRSRKVDHKKSNSGGNSGNSRPIAAAAAKRVNDDDDDVTDSAAAVGSKFQNRTLQVQYRVMIAVGDSTHSMVYKGHRENTSRDVLKNFPHYV